MEVIDEIKVHVVIALCEDLSAIDPNDVRYPIAVDRLDKHWRALSSAEQDEVDRILIRRGLPNARNILVTKTNGT